MYDDEHTGIILYILHKEVQQQREKTKRHKEHSIFDLYFISEAISMRFVLFSLYW